MGKKSKRPSVPEPAPAPAILGTDEDIADQLFAALDERDTETAKETSDSAPVVQADAQPASEESAPRMSRQKARLVCTSSPGTARAGHGSEASRSTGRAHREWRLP